MVVLGVDAHGKEKVYENFSIFFAVVKFHLKDQPGWMGVGKGRYEDGSTSGFQ